MFFHGKFVTYHLLQINLLGITNGINDLAQLLLTGSSVDASFADLTNAE